MTVNETIAVKQGMIGYLWEQWESHDVAYHDVQTAVGDVDWLLESWHRDEASWDAVLDELSDELNRRIE